MKGLLTIKNQKQVIRKEYEFTRILLNKLDDFRVQLLF